MEKEPEINLLMSNLNKEKNKFAPFVKKSEQNAKQREYGIVQNATKPSLEAHFI